MRRRALVLTAILAALPRLAASQRIELGVASVAASHHLLGGNLVGGTARIRLPWNADKRAGYISFERLTGTGRRFGGTCGGFPPPGDPCNQAEPLRDEGRLWTAAAAFALRTLARPHLAIDVAPGIRVGHVRAVTHGETSGATLTGSTALMGVDLRVDVTWAPLRRVPVAITAGFGVGALVKASPVKVVDGYEPFGGFGTTRFGIGAAWWPRRTQVLTPR